MKNGKTKTERVLEDLKIPSSQQLPSGAVSLLQETRSFEIIFAIFSLWASEGVETFGETIYKWDKEEKKKQRRKVAFVT